RAARLRHPQARVRARPALRRAEVAQAVHLVLSRRGRLPRGGHQPHPRRSRRRHPAALPAPGGPLQRARRNLDDRGRGAPQARPAPLVAPPRARRARSDAAVNPLLSRLQPYPFERLRALLAGTAPAAGFSPVDLSIGEPKHPTPAFIREALTRSLDGLAAYPR